MALISLAYVSYATRNITEDDILGILNTARDFNSEHNITGMLLYRNGYFIQALEGEEEVVMPLYEKIAKDERHASVMTVHREEIEERTFGNWAMGFNNLDQIEAHQLDGYTDFLNQPLNEERVSADGNHALALLELFKEGSAY